MGHHLPRPLIKSSAYPVQLPTCQQSHAPTTPTCQQSHAPTTTSRGHSSNHQHIQYNYPTANNLMPVQLPTCQQSHARTITHLPTISCPHHTHLPTISCPHHHLPRPLIKSSAYPVQLPTCQQSHAPPTHPPAHPPTARQTSWHPCRGGPH